MSSSLPSDLQRWEQAGLIDAATAARIQRFEDTRDETGNKGGSPLSGILSLFGGLMMVLGLILLAGWQWEVLSQVQQTGLVFALLLASLGYVGFALWKAGPCSGRLHREISATVWFAVTGAVPVLLSEIWQMPGDTGLWLRGWAFITLPMLWLMRSYALSMLMLGLLFALSIFAIGNPGDGWALAGLWLVLGLSLPWYLLLLHHTRVASLREAHAFALGLLPLLILPANSIAGESALLNYLALGSLMALLAFLSGQSALQRWLLFWGLSTAAFVLLLTSFFFVWEGFDLAALNRPKAWAPFLAMSAGMLLLHGYYRKRGLSELPEIRAAALLVLPFAGVLLLSDFHPGLAQAGANLILLLFGILMMLAGTRGLRPVFLNFGVLLLSAQLLSRFFEAEFPLWVRGLGFLTAGLSLLLANRWLSTKSADTPKPQPSPEPTESTSTSTSDDPPGARDRLLQAAIRFGKDLNA